MTRSFSIVLIVASLVVGAALGLITWSSVEGAPTYQIVDIRSDYGHMVVEVQHFNPDGSHWFFELYTWAGREADKHPRVTDSNGRLFIRGTGKAAAYTEHIHLGRRYYLKPGQEWLREGGIFLTNESITTTIEAIHRKRLVTGWTKGAYRLNTGRLDYTQDDAPGARRLVNRFKGLRRQAYLIQDGTSMALGPRPITDIPLGTAFGTVSTFYPDSHPESTSVDGDVARGTAGTWSAIQGGAGTSGDALSAQADARINASGSTDQWATISRLIFLFDTSAIDAGDIISAAYFGFVSSSKQEDFTQSLSLATTNPASNTNVVPADYSTFGSVKQATDITVASITSNGSTVNQLDMNSTGLGNIDKSGITKLGTRISGDMTNTEPTWGASDITFVRHSMAEETGAGDDRPRLVVTHTVPSADITGTIGDGATEQEVRDGGGTIIITLTGDTWVAAGATFDAQRQAIIDGLDSAQSEANGWNAEVRDQLGVTSVVRTSSSVATITIAAADVGDYRIDDPDVVTVTVPNAALVTSTGDITGTPTFTVTGAAESVAVSGTLGASGGTAAEIRAGGETIILTLTNTKWVTSGATFDAQRQAIIDGLDSNLADENGWDNRRGDFAVGDVIRTSDTVVTITLSASSAYAIPQTETITAVVPAAAVVYGVALTGAPSFNIVPTFVAAGTRTSGAIDLSSITDVAYCAIGWQATTPTDTTVTVTTSVDGGANYSSATNGECPTGIAVGDSLSTITDFRMKVALNTNDNTVTPLVEGLGLLVQDTADPALYYQLNTVPGVTITDRSANSNTGTMSFPVSQTGVNATTGVLESTRSSLSLEQLLSVGDIVSPVTGAAAAGNIFNQTETGFGSLPFQSMMQTMAIGGELPLKFVWVVAIGLFSIALGVVALHFTGSLMISGVGMGAGLSVGAAIGAGLIPGWTVILFVILALALIVMRSRGALPL